VISFIEINQNCISLNIKFSSISFWHYSKLLYVKILKHGKIFNIIESYLCTWVNLHFKSMGQGPPGEANSRSYSRRMSRLLWNPKFHFCVHESPSLVLILKQMDAIYILKLYFFKIHFIIMLPSTPWSPSWFLPSSFSMCTKLDLITLRTFGEDENLWSSSLCSFLHPSIISSILGPNILRSIRSHIPSICVLPLWGEIKLDTHTNVHTTDRRFPTETHKHTELK